MIRTFMCYARSDDEFVLEFARQLRSLGADIWLDQWSIPDGADWDRAIDDALRACDVCVVVLSPGSVESGEVRGEIRVALDERKPIVPVLHRTCDVPRQIRVLQNIDIRETQDIGVAAAEVWATVVRLKNEGRRADLEPASRRPPALDVRLQRTRYVNYVFIDPAVSPLPVEVPTYSWIRTEPGLVGVGARQEDAGRSRDHADGTMAHVPDSELLVDFTLVGHGPTAVISRIELEVEHRLELPGSVARGAFLPILEPITDTAVIASKQQRYPLFGDRTLALKPGDVDLLRVDVVIADDEGPGIFAFRFVVTYNDGDEQIARTPLLYLTKSYAGPTKRISVAKRPDAAPARSEDADGAVARDADDLWMDPRYPEQLLEFSHCGRTGGGDDLEYLVKSFRRTVMGGKRSELQRHGSQPAPWADRVGESSSFQPVFVPVDPTHGLGYRSTSRGGTIIYEQLSTPDYDCLLEACHRLGAGGAGGQRAAIRYLVSQLRSAEKGARLGWLWRRLGFVPKLGLDAAGVLDTLTLLSLFRSREAYDVVVEFLTVEHPLVLDRVARILSAVRYRPAAAPLARLVRLPASYATLALLWALRLNGEPGCFDSLVEACAGFRPENIALAADVLVHLNPDRARGFARDNAGESNEVRRVLAFGILDALATRATSFARGAFDER